MRSAQSVVPTVRSDAIVATAYKIPGNAVVLIIVVSCNLRFFFFLAVGSMFFCLVGGSAQEQKVFSCAGLDYRYCLAGGVYCEAWKPEI